MMPVVTQPAVSGWDVFGAWGTWFGAVATLAAVVGAFALGRKERGAAKKAQDAILEAQRAKERREHELDLLLTLSQLVGAYIGTLSQHGADNAALLHGMAIANALPHMGVSAMPAVCALFEVGDRSQHDYVTRYGDYDPRTAAKHAAVELSQRVRQVAGT